ncbi:MAG: hypothetical protein H6738_21305 [Alphaproteobacteria bacterium]|nr:hypothetical protein [Alphaproteobacteria bacterium]
MMVAHALRSRLTPEGLALGIDLLVAPALGPSWAYVNPCWSCHSWELTDEPFYDIEAVVWHLGALSVVAAILSLMAIRQRPRRWVPPLLWSLLNLAQCVFILNNDLWSVPTFR